MGSVSQEDHARCTWNMFRTSWEILMECCSQTIFLLWPKIAAVGEILWSPTLQPNDDDDDDNDERTYQQTVTKTNSLIKDENMASCLQRGRISKTDGETTRWWDSWRTVTDHWWFWSRGDVATTHATKFGVLEWKKPVFLKLLYLKGETHQSVKITAQYYCSYFHANIIILNESFRPHLERKLSNPV